MNDKIINIVGKVLNEFPETRDDDRLLVVEVWGKQGMLMNSLQKKFLQHCFSPETITRARRHFQALGKYQMSKEALEKRMKKQQQLSELWSEEPKNWH